MRKKERKMIQSVFHIRNIAMSSIAVVILIWAFFQNKYVGKLMISPFIICATAVLGENLFSLLDKEKIVKIFQLIFRISFFTYVFGFLLYAFYYSITTKSYSLIIVILIFLLFAIKLMKAVFFRKK